MEKILTEIYYNAENPSAFGSEKDLYEAALKRNKKIKIKQVKDFLAKQNTFTLHKPIRTHFKRRKTLARNLDNIWQIDLCDMKQIAKYNSNNHFLLTIIDVLSRYAWALPLKNKKGVTIVNAFKQLFKKTKRKPLKIQSDLGTEFHNHHFKKFLREKKIILYSTFSDTKAALVERFNRTLKTKIWKYFTAKNTLHWLRVLPKLMKAYNLKKHSAHGFSPVKITKKNQKQVWEKLYSNYLNKKIKPPKFKTNDLVRLSKFRKTFFKGYLKGWTNEIFRIFKVLKTRPTTYTIVDENEEIIRGSFYENELIKVK